MTEAGVTGMFCKVSGVNSDASQELCAFHDLKGLKDTTGHI